MAFNGLVANQGKTEFLLLNDKTRNENPFSEILVGSTIVKRTDRTKLLGMLLKSRKSGMFT